jgi:hypothetical protein
MTAVQRELDFSVTDKAIEAARVHADQVHEKWSDKALEFLKGYAEINPYFMIEDVRNASVGLIPEPPTKKAWGAIARSAAHKGMIRRAGYQQVKNVKAHHTPASVWQSLIIKKP